MIYSDLGKVMTIEVLDIRILNGDRSLRAFADVKINNWIIREWRIIQEAGKRPLIVSPQVSWKNPAGNIQYKTIITVPDEIKGELDRIILNRYIEETEKRQDARK